jgi:exopolyphosphatase/guanosine-5'-triphosphate,3'-diphosphate pyrophosphatase
MIVASIDIGTNTVLLLIAEVTQTAELKPILNEYRMPRIGKGIEETKIINPEKIKLLFDVLNEYDLLIKKYNCDKVIITGTYALRVARNKADIIKSIREIFNYKIEIIPGELEAEYAFLGATSNLKANTDSLVIDIGGGSTEVILGARSKILTKRSIQIGSVSATEKYLKHSPPFIKEVENLKKDIKTLFGDLSSMISFSEVIAIAGTATTLSCMNLGLNDFAEDRVEMSSLSIMELDEIILQLQKLKPLEILENYGSVMKGREDIILAGAIILSEFMKFFRIENVKVSSRGIRYGAIIKYLTESTNS